MGKKGSMPSFATIDDYIANQPVESQKLLRELRAIVHEAVPEAVELLNYKVPSFTLVSGCKTEQQLMMAGYAKFVSFYPFPSTMAAFAKAFEDYKQGKGSVQFPFDRELPKDLIIKMIKHRRDEILAEISE